MIKKPVNGILIERENEIILEENDKHIAFGNATILDKTPNINFPFRSIFSFVKLGINNPPRRSALP